MSGTFAEAGPSDIQPDELPEDLQFYATLLDRSFLLENGDLSLLDAPFMEQKNAPSTSSSRGDDNPRQSTPRTSNPPQPFSPRTASQKTMRKSTESPIREQHALNGQAKGYIETEAPTRSSYSRPPLSNAQVQRKSRAHLEFATPQAKVDAPAVNKQSTTTLDPFVRTPSQVDLAELAGNVRETAGDIPQSLVGSSATTCGNYLYVFGGRHVQSRTSMGNDMWRLNLETLHWELAARGSPDGPRSRYFHSAVAVQNTIVIFGGQYYVSKPRMPNKEREKPEPHVLDDMWSFDTASLQWIQIIPACDAGIKQPAGRYAHLAVALGSGDSPLGYLLIIGGQDASNAYIYNASLLDLDRQVWVASSPLEKPFGAYRTAACPDTPHVYPGRAIAAPSWASPHGSKGKRHLYRLTSAHYTDTLPGVLLYSNVCIPEPDGRQVVRQGMDLLTITNTGVITTTMVPVDMSHGTSPVGLRFPVACRVGHHFVLAGTHLNGDASEYVVYAAPVTSYFSSPQSNPTFAWTQIKTGSLLSKGSWNQSALTLHKSGEPRIVLLGEAGRSLRHDYDQRRISFRHVASIHLPAFGVRLIPGTSFDIDQCALGLTSLGQLSLSDFALVSSGEESLACNSRLLAARWPWFKEHVQPSAHTVNIPYPTSTVHALLEFIYTGHLCTSAQLRLVTLCGLLLISHDFSFPDLRAHVVHALFETLDIVPSASNAAFRAAALVDEWALQLYALQLGHSTK